MAKSPNAFRTIREVASWLGTQSHVLRFWESKFNAVAPVQRTGGRRYYRKNDMMLLGGIKFLLHEQGMTIKAVQRLLKDKGTAHVQSYSPKINLIESSNISKKHLSETIHSNSDKPIDSLNGLHAKKTQQTSQDFPSEPLAHKDQPFLFSELQLDPEKEDSKAKATIAQNTTKPPETTTLIKPAPPLTAGAGLSKMDPKLAKFVGKIGPITQIFKLSIVDQSHLISQNTLIINQLQKLLKKLSV